MPANPTLLEARATRALEAIGETTPDELVALIERSGLRGRGGAGHPLAHKLAAARAAAATSGASPLVVANAYDADPASPLSRTLITRGAAAIVDGVAIAARIVASSEAIVYLHPDAKSERAAMERAIAERRPRLGGLDVTTALGPGGFMGGEESALMNVLESRRAMARQRPPYPAQQGVAMRPTLIGCAETLAWLPLIVDGGAAPLTKLVSVTGAVRAPGVYEVALGTTLGAILEKAGGADGALKGIHVGGPTSGILAASRADVRFDFEDLAAAGVHMGSAQVRAVPATACIVAEAARLWSYLERENCGICVPCRVGTARVTGILEGVQSQLGRESDLAWLGELGDHMAAFSLCGFGLTAPSILRTTMREFAADYRAHIDERRCPTGTCAVVRSRRYETMAQP